RRRAGVAVCGRQRNYAGTVLRHRAGARDQTAEADIVRAVEYERTIVRHIACDETAGSAIAELQRAIGDCGAASVGVVSRQDRCARSKLLDGTAAGYLARNRQRVGAIELQRRIVCDVAGKRARCTAISDTKRAGGDCRSVAIAMVTGQGEEAAVLLCKAFKGSDACAVESACDCIVDNQA